MISNSIGILEPVLIKSAIEKPLIDDDIHKYEEDGFQYIPIFTNRHHAESFCGAYTSLIKEIHTYRIFSTPGTMLKNWIGNEDLIIINDQNNSEILLEKTETQEIAKFLPNTDNNSLIKLVTIAVPLPVKTSVTLIPYQ